MIELSCQYIPELKLSVCSSHVTYAFQSEFTLHEMWSLSDCNWTGTNNHLVPKKILNYLAKLAEWLYWILSNYLNSELTLCSSHITYAFHSESALYSCLNVKKILAQNKRKIWFLSDWNWTKTDNHLLRKRTLHHLAKMAKSLSWVVNTYLYDALTVCSFHVTYTF